MSQLQSEVDQRVTGRCSFLFSFTDFVNQSPSDLRKELDSSLLNLFVSHFRIFLIWDIANLGGAYCINGLIMIS